MFGASAGGIASALAGGALSKLFGGGQKAASGGIQGDVLATDNNSVGMGDAGITSAIPGSNVPTPEEAVPSFVSYSLPTTLQSANDVYPLDGRKDGGYYTVKDCLTIYVIPRTTCNIVYVGFMVCSKFNATKCRGLVSLNHVIK